MICLKWSSRESCRGAQTGTCQTHVSANPGSARLLPGYLGQFLYLSRPPRPNTGFSSDSGPVGLCDDVSAESGLGHMVISKHQLY